MVAYTGYDSDNRVLRYAEALAKRGHQVDAVSLRREGQSKENVVNGVRVFRIQQRIRNERNKFVYFAKMLLFFFRSMGLLTREHLRERYDLIHVHSIPDFEVFAALIPKLMGAKIILDIHDILPEFYASKFNALPNSMIFKLLVAEERLSTAFSDHVIAANHIWQKRLQERSVESSKCTTFLNYPDTAIFRREGRNRNDKRFVILYPGSLNYHQGLDLAVQAFALIKSACPEAQFWIYGEGEQREFLKSLIAKLGLEDRVFLMDPLPLHQLVSVMENADLGVVPKRKDGFGNEAFSTKTLEFMSMGIPVIVPDTAVDKYYFDDSVAQFFHANDERSLADAMLLLIRNADLREKLVKNASEFVKKYSWEANQASYLNLVDSLVHSFHGRKNQG